MEEKPSFDAENTRRLNENNTYTFDGNTEESRQEKGRVPSDGDLVAKINRLEVELAESQADAEKLRQTVSQHKQLFDKIAELENDLNYKNQELSEKDNKIAKLEKDFNSKKQEIVSLNEQLNKPGSLWGWLATHFPNFFRDGEAKINKLENEIKKLEKEVKAFENEATSGRYQYQSLVKRYNQVVKKDNQLNTQQQQEKQKWESERKSMEKQIDSLKKTSDEQLGKIARLNDKPAESIGDYEKREDYQIATDYKAFCTQQSLEVITEDIYGYYSQRKENLQDNTKRAFFIAEIKATLSKAILVKAYKVQLRQLIKKQPLLEFDDFFELHSKKLLSQFKLSEELAEQLKKTANKGFSLVSQLVSTNPPCQLLFFAEEGDIFDPEEYEAATGCPPKEGVVKFTVAPGVLSGSQILMKPIVFTEIKEPNMVKNKVN